MPSIHSNPSNLSTFNLHYETHNLITKVSLEHDQSKKKKTVQRLGQFQTGVLINYQFPNKLVILSMLYCKHTHTHTY